MARVWLCVGLCVLLLAGCHKDKSSAVCEVIKSSNFGLGLSLNMAPSAIAGVLGQAQASESRMGGKSIVDYYIPAPLIDEELTVQPIPSPETPQLAVSYFDGKLRKLYNKWVPGDNAQPEPPFYIEIVQGVRLRARKSDFTDALGTASDEENTEWRFTDAEGGTVSISATFTHVESAATDICDSLLVVYAPPVEVNRGEDIG